MVSLTVSLYIAPKATAALLNLESSLKNQQASFQVEPRVFYEDFKNYVLYVQDIRAGTGVSRWQRIFLADLSDPVAPKVTTAAEAVVAEGGDNTLLMRLRNGTEHELVSTTNGPEYQVSTFLESELPLSIGTQEEAHIGHNDTPILAMSNRVLYQHTKGPDGRIYQIELRKAFRLSGSLPGSDADRYSHRHLIAARGQERRFCGDHRAGLYLLFLFFDRQYAGSRRQGPGLRRGVGGEHPLCFMRPVSAAPDGDWRISRHAIGGHHQQIQDHAACSS